ncbi:uncharacterized protein EV422DRAFT_492245, partial [Fimicolochytrium jonesii]|uniref:uncharacterized protein n=1 Tax=Fimicolochytrium jonesii TaxID=1396493 RepID=UPI0022FE39DA
SPLILTWRDQACPICGAHLMENERESPCCQNGQLLIGRLPPYPPALENAFQAHQRNLGNLSRRLNYLFAFSAIGVADGSFKRFHTGPKALALNGRIYHRMLPADMPGHSIHWLLYDDGLHHLPLPYGPTTPGRYMYSGLSS